MDVSVIIVTYNRKDLLQKTLHALEKQEGLQTVRWELIVVDHNCSDGTTSFLADFSRHTSLPLRVIEEKHPSLSAGRNAGIRSASGQYLLFTDDDVIPSKNWVERMYHAFSQHEPDAVGGKVLPIYPANTPEWIMNHQRFLNGAIVFRDAGSESRFYSSDMLPFVGANMGVSRRCFERIGYFNEDLGPGTKYPTGGEDIEMYSRIREQGKVYYAAEATVSHMHPADRMNFGYVTRWYHLHGHGIAQRHQRSLSQCERRVLGVPGYLIRELVLRGFRVCKDTFRADRRLITWCKFVWMTGYCRGARQMKSNVEKDVQLCAQE